MLELTELLPATIGSTVNRETTAWLDDMHFEHVSYDNSLRLRIYFQLFV